jgi:uncharacterized protein (TIGR00730 family)
MNKNILVFCSANDLSDTFTIPAKKFARLMTKHGYNLVWGGSDRGLMREIATEVQKNGGKIIGISAELFRNIARKNADEMIIAKDLGERKALMLKRSDAIAVLVGGIGTLDEISEVLALRKLDVHTKPIVVLNTDNFFRGFKIQLQKMKSDGFIQNKTIEQLVHFADTPQDAIAYINNKLA